MRERRLPMPKPRRNTASIVLIVDDNRDNLHIACRFLELTGGFQPVPVQDPSRVVEVARSMRPEAILMDILMPGLDGYQVCRQLKRVPALADVPVVFVTGKDDEESIGRAFEAGGVDYVVKPLDRRALGVRLNVHIDHYRARRELRQSEARLRAAQATARLADWEANPATGLFSGSPWTFNLCRIVGTRDPEGETLHAPVADLLSCLVADHRERLQQALRCLPGQPEREAHCRSIVDGKVRELHFVAHAEADGGGTRILGTVQDVTERHAALESLRRAEQRLMESKRIEAVGRLAGGVAHEFNNLLQAIMGYSSMLSRRLGKDSPEQRLLQPILTAGERARELVNQILLVGRQGTFAPQILDLPSFAESFVPTVEKVLEAPNPIVVSCAAVLPVRADPGLLEHVLMNLCHNALQATSEGGSVTVTVDPVALEEPLQAVGSVIPAGQYVRLAVRDTGTGISPDILERVFDPFFTTRPVGKGSGLGLPAVLGIVRQHRSHLLVTSSPGEGTTAAVYFAPAPKADSVDDGTPLPARVLVVASDELLRGILALHLGELGCEVWAAACVAEAKLLFRDRDQPVEALVVYLPGLPASEQSWLAESAGRLPVIGVLGDDHENDPNGGTLPRGVLPLPLPVTTESLRQGLLGATHFQS